MKVLTISTFLSTLVLGLFLTPIAHATPASGCQEGFQRAGRLCIDSELREKRRHVVANVVCENEKTRVCTLSDLTYLYLKVDYDAQYNPDGVWLKSTVGDSTALCGNRQITQNGDPDQYDFDGECHAWDNRHFWCCHDAE